MASPIRTLWRVKAGTVGNFEDLSSVLPLACEDATPATATGVAFPANRNEWRERKSKGKALVAYKSLGRAAAWPMAYAINEFPPLAEASAVRWNCPLPSTQ